LQVPYGFRVRMPFGQRRGKDNSYMFTHQGTTRAP
jgi:hypothetical protein